MPRQRKPLEEHKRDGTFRADRHGAIANAEQLVADGKPQMPVTFVGDAKEFWEQRIAPLVELKVAKALDTPQLVAMCEWWARYRKVSKALDDADPTGDPFLYTRLSASTARCWQMFSKIAAKFGMSPADRASLRIEGEAKKKGVAVRQRG